MVPTKRFSAWRSWGIGVIATAGLFQAVAGDEIPSPGSRSWLDSLLPPRFSLPANFFSQEGSITNPMWKTTNLATVEFSSRGDQRRNLSYRGGANDFETFQLNESGLIQGEELFSLIHPVERAFFDQVMRSQGRQGDYATLYREYLQQNVDQGMALLLFNRILDHESVKRKIAPGVSWERSSFLAQGVLIRFAMDSGKVRTVGTGDELKLARDALVGVREDRLYSWLKEAAGERSVAFNFDWTFKEGQDYEYDDLKKEIGGAAWPAVRLVFDKLPSDYYAFREAVAQQLLPTYRRVVRMNLWRALVAERRPNLVWESLFSVTNTELAAMYEALKGRFRVQPISAQVTDVEISGPKASEFKARFLAVLTERQAALLREIFGSTPPSPTAPQPTAEEQDRLKARILEIRRTVPREVLAQLLTEFAASIGTGELLVQAVDRELTSDGVTPIPNDSAPDSVRRRNALNPVFSASALFPKVETLSDQGVTTVLLLKDQTRGEARFLPASDPRVEQVLRDKIQSKTQGKVFRELVYTMLRENRMTSMVDTCADPAWPCVSRDAQKLTEALFPEVLYPGRAYGNWGPGRPISSSLADPQELPKVMEISMEGFARVFEIPNANRPRP